MIFNDDFKEELRELPSKEKDKLILRLLKKDRTLASRLYFELIESNTGDERREAIKERIDSTLNGAYGYGSPGYLMMDMRYLSGDISQHVKVTKDKYGEVSLSLHLMIIGLTFNKDTFGGVTSARAWKCSTYIIAKAFKTIILIQKMHEDLQFEFQDDLVRLGELMNDTPHVKEAMQYHEFKVLWLLEADIPSDIALIEKDLRKKGLLTSRKR
jgi:hypothetical protein